MKNFIKLTVVIILLLESRFFYISTIQEKIDKYNNLYNKSFIVLIIVLSSAVIAIYKFRNGLKRNLFDNCVVALIFIYIIQVFSSSILYNENIIKEILLNNYFFIILFYFILVNFLDNEKNYNFFIKINVLFSSIVSILYIIYTILYNKNGIELFNIYELTIGTLPYRDGSIRLVYPATMITFSILISFSELLKWKKKSMRIFYFVGAICGMIYMIVVCQTRMLTISIVVSLIIPIIVRKVNNVRKIIKAFGIILVVFIVLSAGKSNDFLSSFTEESQMISIEARAGALDYFIERTLENPFTPVGLTTGEEGTEVYDISHGKDGTFYASDVGIIGLMSTLGVLGVIWYVYMVVKLINIMNFVRKCNSINENIELVVLITYIILTTGTLIITDCGRMILLPIIMSIFEYKYKKCIEYT